MEKDVLGFFIGDFFTHYFCLYDARGAWNMYIEKLTKKDIEELESVVMGCDAFDREHTIIRIDRANAELSVVFWEEIPPDDDEPVQGKKLCGNAVYVL